MQAIEVRPRQLTAAHAVHARPISGAPRLGKLFAVDAETLLLRQRLYLARHRRPPIDDGAERIEDQGLHAGRRREADAKTCADNGSTGLEYLAPRHSRDRSHRSIVP